MNSEILKQLEDIDKWTKERDAQILQNAEDEIEGVIDMMIYLYSAIKK